MRGEAGYTLIELLVVVAMIAILTAVSTEYLAQQPAQLSSAIQQFTLKLEETRALALANAGRLDAANGTQAAAGGGATLWVQPDQADPNYTIASVYWYRPISLNGNGGGVSPDITSSPLRVRASLSAHVPADGQSQRFAIFVSPAGHLSVATDHVWKLGDGPIGQEPRCDPSHPARLAFSTNQNTKFGTLMCNGATLSIP
jgi:prepilin-type N-terminal cleavage/methylation domain-containing protein